MIEIIPNSIPKEDQDYVENLISSNVFDWYHLGNSNYDKDDGGIEPKSKILSTMQGYSEYRQFRHIMFNDRVSSVSGTDVFYEIFPRIRKGIKYQDISMLHARINMLLPLADSPLYAVGLPHVDWKTTEDTQFTGLYYVNDSDGDTIIYNETLKDDIPEELTISHRIKPTKGTLILFNTYHIHSGCLPSTGRRMVINFNFKVLDINS